MSYWGAMYIPVVVAMAAKQNVVAALRGGPVALLSAIGGRGGLRLLHRRSIAPRTGRDEARRS